MKYNTSFPASMSYYNSDSEFSCISSDTGTCEEILDKYCYIEKRYVSNVTGTEDHHFPRNKLSGENYY